LETILKNRLRNARKIAILGIGSELRADDAAGMVLARRLQAQIKKKRTRSLKVFLGETAPENLTGEIKRFKPTHLIIIDAADFHEKPGAVGILDGAGEIGVSFSTHSIPIQIMKDYLFESTGCETIVIGIQPESLEFRTGLSERVEQSLKVLSRDLMAGLKIRGQFSTENRERGGAQ
jgi:hydrogenase 3 maturation protease